MWAKLCTQAPFLSKLVKTRFLPSQYFSLDTLVAAPGIDGKGVIPLFMYCGSSFCKHLHTEWTPIQFPHATQCKIMISLWWWKFLNFKFHYFTVTWKTSLNIVFQSEAFVLLLIWRVGRLKLERVLATNSTGWWRLWTLFCLICNPLSHLVSMHMAIKDALNFRRWANDAAVKVSVHSGQRVLSEVPLLHRHGRRATRKNFSKYILFSII